MKILFFFETFFQSAKGVLADKANSVDFAEECRFSIFWIKLFGCKARAPLPKNSKYSLLDYAAEFEKM